MYLAFWCGSCTRIDEELDISVSSHSSVRMVLPVGYLALAVQLRGQSRVVELDENRSRWGLGASIRNLVALGTFHARRPLDLASTATGARCWDLARCRRL